MSAKSTLNRLRAQMALYGNSDQNTDVAVISAIMDELTGDKPEGTADAIEAKQNRLTGYTFPANAELRRMLKEGSE